MRQIIKDKGLLNKDVAADMKFARTYFQNLISKSDFGPDIVAKFCKVVKVDQAIFYREQSPNKLLPLDMLAAKLDSYDHNMRMLENRISDIENELKSQKVKNTKKHPR